jgi:hypothetical protein
LHASVKLQERKKALIPQTNRGLHNFFTNPQHILHNLLTILSPSQILHIYFTLATQMLEGEIKAEVRIHKK